MAGNITVYMYVRLQRKITGSAWTTLQTVTFSKIAGSGIEEGDVQAVLDSFTLDWVEGAQYRIQIEKDMNWTGDIVGGEVRVYGASIE